MSLSLAENVIVAGADNRPHMLVKSNYSSWASRMLLYIKGKLNGKLLVDFVLNGPFQFGTIIVPETETTPATVRERTYTHLTAEEKLRESVDIIATKIVLQGLPQDIYNLVNHNNQPKQIWDRVKLLIQGSELTKKERKSKLYDYFDMFTSQPGETIHSYYMRFSQLINDMHMIGMTMQPVQVNRKFVNHLPTEWGKFVTDVKLAKNMHTTNFDHLYAHLRQHEAHANEVCLNRQRFSNQTALFSSATQSCYSPPASQLYDHPSPFQATAVQQSYHQPQMQQSYQLDSGLVVPSFNTSDDSVVNLNKTVAFLTIYASRFSSTNNQLRTSSNPRNQATIQDGRVTVQTVQGRQHQGNVNTGIRNNVVTQGTNRTGGQAQVRMIKCYNYQENGHMARECTKPKRRKNSAWFKEKLLLTEALESGVCLDPEQLGFLADNGDAVIPDQATLEVQTPTAFQTDDLDAYDLDYDETSSA
ncbi:zf-CCHC domain-containing protein [Tanacetum coccineum]